MISLRSLYQQARVRVRARRYLRRGEPDECRFTCDVLEPGQSVLDIGAYKAAYTYWMSRRVKADGHVYGFEPQADLARYLEAFASGCRHRNVTVCPVALADTRGRGRLRIPGHPGWAHLQGPGESSPDRIRDVDVETLDAYAARVQLERPVAFIKCDVELHELAVFRGGRELLQTDRPVLLFESLPLTTLPNGRSATFEFLQEMGFRGHFFCSHELVPLTRYSPATHTLTHTQVQNYVFIHPASVALTHPRPPFRLARVVASA